MTTSPYVQILNHYVVHLKLVSVDYTSKTRTKYEFESSNMFLTFFLVLIFCLYALLLYVWLLQSCLKLSLKKRASFQFKLKKKKAFKKSHQMHVKKYKIEESFGTNINTDTAALDQVSRQTVPFTFSSRKASQRAGCVRNLTFFLTTKNQI